MDDAALNISIRSFLKQFGVAAQREMERAVARGLETGALRGDETLPVRATLVVDGIVRDFHVDGTLTLDG
jgi:hypothetical protein